MGRTGTQENKAADSQYQTMQTQALQRTNAATDAFNNKLKTLQTGGTIAANPYADKTYLTNQNNLIAGATSGTNKATQENLDQEALRTGSNTGARKATIADLGRQRMRTAADMTSSQNADNYSKYLDWEKFILGSTLAPTGADTSVFSTATGGRSNADTNLANLGIAQSQMWSNIVGSGLQAGATAAAGRAGQGGCWIAMAIWGDTDPRTLITREWLNTEFIKSRIGRMVMALYYRFGERVAKQVRKHGWLKAALTPVFEVALDKALDWKLRG